MTTPYQKRVDIGGCTLYLGDSKQLADAGLLKADALISDPPYGIGFQYGESKGDA